MRNLHRDGRAQGTKREKRGSDPDAARHRQWFAGLVAAIALAVALPVGCSNGEVVGANGRPGGDGGAPSEAGLVAPASDAAQSQEDAASDDSGDAQIPVGTTGKPCTSDSSCTSANGDTCSNDYVTGTAVAGIVASPLPAPLCLLPPTQDNCDPAPASDPFGEVPHFCDGPDDPSSPGICLPDNPQEPLQGMGTCQPKCTFDTLGSAEVGCPSPDTCVYLTFQEVSVGNAVAVVGFGFCQGTCQKDTDCPQQPGSTTTCQTDVGLCTTQPVARTLAIGAACTFTDFNSGACNCDSDPDTGLGFCTTVCVVGGTPCPSGWVCDSGEPSTASVANGFVTISAQNLGLAGVCLPACSASSVAAIVPVSIDAGNDDAEVSDAAALVDAMVADVGTSSPAPDAGAGFATCPGQSTCTPGNVAGTDCVP